MKILVLKIKLRASWVRSLKEKRMILLSISKKLKNKFNISISEVGSQDIHEIIELGVTTISNSKEVLYSTMEEVLTFVESNTDAEIVEIYDEIIII